MAHEMYGPRATKVMNRYTNNPKKKVSVGKGMTMTKKAASAARKKPGGSNVGKYKNVSSTEFAGPAGGAPKGSYPINTKKRAKAALAYSRNAPNPSGIKKKVYAKYPSMKKSSHNPY